MSATTCTTAASPAGGYAEWAAVGPHQWVLAGWQYVIYQSGPDRFELWSRASRTIQADNDAHSLTGVFGSLDDAAECALPRSVR